jgi:uncharacterized protein with HEPN domain
MEFEDFLADARTQDAVIRCLEVVGEACGQLLRSDPHFEVRHPALEVAKAYRARNRTAHGYGSVDLATVWMSAKVSCPRLVEGARGILRSDAYGSKDG